MIDFKKSELQLTHFNFIPVVFILLQDPCSMERSWWHCHWSLRKGKNTKSSVLKNQLWKVTVCSSMCMEGIKLYLSSFIGPHYSCFLSLHKPVHKSCPVWGREGIQSPYNSIFKEQKEREINAEFTSFCSLPVQPITLGWIIFFMHALDF